MGFNMSIGLKVKDVNEEILLLFYMSYEYGLNFFDLLKLFKVSKKYFCIFMNVMSPSMKVGARKGTLMRSSVQKMYKSFLAGDSRKLDVKETNVLKAFSLFVEDAFENESNCFKLDQIKAMPFALGYNNKNMLLSNSYTSLKTNVDNIDYLVIGDMRLYKTCLLLHYIEKLKGDVTIREILGLPVPELLRAIQDISGVYSHGKK